MSPEEALDLAGQAQEKLANETIAAGTENIRQAAEAGYTATRWRINTRVRCRVRNHFKRLGFSVKLNEHYSGEDYNILVCWSRPRLRKILWAPIAAILALIHPVTNLLPIARMLKE